MTVVSETIPEEATASATPPQRAAGVVRGARNLVWPGDQPFWARPALFVLTGVAAFMYAWQSSGYLEVYYAAAVRSMSMSWHNFLYSAFDPSGTVSTDKLPGAFWVQALSVRLFGLHDWALVLPQIIEGALTVLVLFRLVRRLAGPVAALLTALIAVVAPANVALNRGNVSDTLMILLVVLAANAIVSAILTGRFVHLIAAAVWVGLAFQAKMIEVWLLLPALALVYLVAAPGRTSKRLVGVGVFAVLAVAVSLSWMLYVTAQPKAGRPYVDGSHSDSVFQQVFDYNGFGRLDQPSPNAVLFKTIGLGALPSSPPGWDRLLTGPFGTDEGWLLPASVVSLGFVLVARRRRPRGDPLRAGALLWGLWLAALVVVFSVSTTINSYYVAALTPAIAGLLGIGAVAAWDLRERLAVRIGAALVIAGTVIYGAWLLPPTGVGLPGWLGVTALAIGGAAAVLLLGSLAWRRLAVVAVALGIGSALLIPTVGSATVVSNKMGSFDTPFESQFFATGAQRLFGPSTRKVALALLPGLERLQTQFGAKDIMATQTAVLAAPTIYVSGLEVYPLGGYNGTGAAPTLSHLQELIAQHYFQIVLVSRTSKDPRYRWVEQHCPHVKGEVPIGGIGVFFCSAP